MSTQANSKEDRLNNLKKTFEETLEDVSSAKDFKKIVDRFKNQLQRASWKEQKELPQHLDDYPKIEPSNFRGIRDKLAKGYESLRQIAFEADLYSKFEALREEEREIIDSVDKNPRVKCHQMSYEFFLRLDELKHDPSICLFLAIFPENAVLKKRFLIYWWIGEGLVPDEDEGERVFEELLDLHLLLPYRTDNRPIVSKCQVFPRIRYMLISLATKKEKKLLMLKDDNRPRFDPTNSRRICLIAEDHKGESKFPDDMRTIFNVNERDLDFQSHELSKQKRLEVLQLGRWQVSPTHHIEVRDESFLTGLKAQKYLKYLSLRGISRITSLPKSIEELVSLQILDLKSCHNLETLPAAIASLEKLTHLDVSECYLLDSLPKGLDKLTSLQVLKGFIIGSSVKTPIRIKNLTSLEKLKRLSIHIGSEATIQKEEFEKLKDLTNLKCLKISWGKKVDVEYTISFPPELKKLDLEGIPHEKKPEWLKPGKLKNLETLYIKGGKLTNLLEREDEKWDNVKYLVLMHTKMPQIKKETLRSMFPLCQYAKQVQREPEISIDWRY
ncbi:hypothetical protein QN277_000906 [Acacia crassicarpa]|uniref:Disease resistance R13L4/SHOC-2-like LRR domain-containing protein n=1 Tax=Acacia crassicarpa TaxID=499986 RepID=A0AAE1TGH0_9FABA|nr:hypothetical protein QN277_000906 [Acacia crassicarpa]